MTKEELIKSLQLDVGHDYQHYLDAMEGLLNQPNGSVYKDIFEIQAMTAEYARLVKVEGLLKLMVTRCINPI